MTSSLKRFEVFESHIFMLMGAARHNAAAIAFRDIKAVLVVILLRNWTETITYLTPGTVQSILLAAIFIVLLAKFCYCTDSNESTHSSGLKAAASTETDTATFLRPLILPCRTTHTRIFPTKHSFSYSYLYVGIPIGWNGPAGSVLSADLADGMSKGGGLTWFSVKAEDYLERGFHRNGLQGKLRDHLSSQGVDPDQYPHALLVTAPRFLGFSFNPVSFWYLYDKDRTLAAMILEVNNTFDERRMYIMQRSGGGDIGAEKGSVFRHAWEKDFHVSPFNDRAGTYSLSASDPFDAAISSMAKIENVIVLNSKDGKPKVVARVFSTEPALDAKTLTRLQTLSFVARWWWVGFMTNPRILREARTLWVKKLELFYRPEVFVTSIGRNETSEERTLEAVFRQFLTQLSQTSHIAIRYIPAAGKVRAKAQTLYLPSNETQHVDTEIEVRVLTPAFYSQIARFPRIMDVFEHCYFNANKGQSMLHISQPSALKELLDSFDIPNREREVPGLAWKFLALLRHSVHGKISKMFENKSGSIALSLSSAPLLSSELDSLVLGALPPTEANVYRKAATRVLLADMIAFGLISILNFYTALIWLVYIYVAGVMGQTLLSLGFGTDCGVILPATSILFVLQLVSWAA